MNRVEDFPARRPRKPLPLRATTMLMLMHAGKVLLEKRPPAGIWGGLWSLPEMPVADGDERRALKAHCAARLDCVIGAVSEPESLRHGFTHFKLDIRVLRCEVSTMTPRAREGERIWLDLDEAQGAAIPAPVKKILRRVCSESPSRFP